MSARKAQLGAAQLELPEAVARRVVVIARERLKLDLWAGNEGIGHGGVGREGKQHGEDGGDHRVTGEKRWPSNGPRSRNSS